MQLTNFPGMIYYNFNHANGRMVERGVTYTGKKISLLVMFCQCTISFGKQKLYVKSGFQFSLKNFWRFLHLQNWYGTLQAKVESLMSNLPSKTSKSEKLSHFYWWPAMIISLSRRRQLSYRKTMKCSRDSLLIFQKLQNGESGILNLKRLLFLK